MSWAEQSFKKFNKALGVDGLMALWWCFLSTCKEKAALFRKTSHDLEENQTA